MKIGILTYHHVQNYGAYIQACALCGRLNQEKNIECEIIDFRMEKEVYAYRLERFSKKMRYLRPWKYKFKKDIFLSFEEAIDDDIIVRSKDSLVSDSIDEFRKFVYGKYDVIIAGSDEIWKIDGFRGFPTPYWLIGDIGCKKFSYAASSRSDFKSLKKDEKKVLIDAINDFEFIGVREQITADSLCEFVSKGNEINVCCDPSLLFDFPVRKKSIPELLSGKYKLDAKKKTILLMTNNKEVALTVLKKCFGKYNLVSVFDFYEGYCNVGKLKPLEWVELLANANLVITTYFHGTCISIVNQTPFITIGSEARSSKIEALFQGECSFKERYIKKTDDFINIISSDGYIEKFMKGIDTTAYIAQKRKGFNIFLDALNKVDDRY